jgi:hypothetical protein
MRWPLLTLFLALGVFFETCYSQDPIQWVQSTNHADSELVAALRKKMDEPSPIKGSESVFPLRHLESAYPIAISLDERSLEEESITPDEPIRFADIPGISIRNQLIHILEPLYLTYVEKPGYLLITSKKTLANVVRLYNVTSIVDARGNGNYNFSPLIGIIEQTIATTDWQIAGGYSSLSEWRTPTTGILVVSAPQVTQDAILDLLNAQRLLLKEATLRQKPRQLRGTLHPSGVRRAELRRPK